MHFVKRCRSWRLACLVMAASGMATAPLLWASPVPDEERIPVDVRRTTLVVKEIERSLPFWRDALGLTVVYDQMIERPLDAEKPDGAKRSLRLVLLRANDTFIGAVGLLEYVSPRRPERAPGEDRPIVGDFIMVVNAADLDARWERVRSVPGVQVLSEPSLVEYPAPAGGVIPVMVSMVRDPDGYFVELNQILGKPAGAAD
jgi:catechol 2,3-dioxygenase-like lactoylglutathione lyase family enzyme